MTPKHFLLFLILLIATNIEAQVTGKAFLEATTNSSGIKVKFLPQSRTAKLDSTLTTDSGNFSIALAGGVYIIEYSKAGFQKQVTDPILATTTLVLRTITLNKGGIVQVSNEVSGLWSKDSIYNVIGDIQIMGGKSLTIEPGTIIRFFGNYSLRVYGKLTSNGKAGDSIVFTSSKSLPQVGDWKGIIFEKGSDNSSSISHSILKYAANTIIIENVNPTISNNEIAFFYVGILGNASSATISSNVLSNFLYNRPNLTFGIEWNGGSPEIVCNTISNGKGYGIQAFCDGSIANNIIHDLDKDSFAGIEVLRGSPRIGNNYIYKCVNGITIRANTDVTINPTITYNTIISNKYAGITFSTLYSSGVVKDNLISNNAIGILQLSSIDNGINTTPKEVSYNLIFDNGKDFEGVKIIGIGEQVSVNTNGDPVDSYFNVMSSAKFLNDTPPQASAISPSLGAGENKTNIGYNDEGKCSKIVTSAMSKSNSFTSEIYLYPNPVLDYATLNFKHSVQGNTKVVLYNVLGTEVYSKDFNSSDEIKMDLSALGHGTYSCEVSNEDHKKVLKLIK